jgi:tetratricopeptide (TPR) repeat protein
LLLVGNTLDLPGEAKNLVPVARAAVARAGDPVGLRVLLRMNEAMVINGHGEAARALALLEEARAILRDEIDPANPPPNLPELQVAVTSAIGGSQSAAGNYEAALAAQREALAVSVAQLGTEHPRLASIHANMADTLRRADRAAEALTSYQEAARIVEASLGESPVLVKTWERIGDVLVELDRQEESLAWFDRSRALADKLLKPDDPARILVIQSKGLALRELGRVEEALAIYDEVVAAWERVKTNASHLRVAYHNRGGSHRELGHWDLALADYQRALAMYEVDGQVDHRGINTLVGIGLTFLEAGRPAKAIAPLERAVAVARPEKFAGMQIVGKWLLGRAKVESGQDVAGGHAAVQAARAELAATGEAAEEIAKLDAWVAKARRR